MKLSTVLKIVFPLLIVMAVVLYFVEFGKGGEVKVEDKVESSSETEAVVSEDQVVEERSEEKVSRPTGETMAEEVKSEMVIKSGVVEEKIIQPVEVTEAQLTDRELIEKYYAKLEEKKLEDAYALKYDTENVSFAKFKGWYGSVKSAEVSDFASKGDNKYQFTVYLIEENGVEEKYLVNMEVIGGLLKTTSSQKTWDNYSPEAFTKKVNGKTNLYVKEGNTEKLVKEFDDINADPVDRLELEKYTVVGDKYVVYLARGWEWVVGGVFDIKSGKEVHAFGGGTEDYGFSKDLKYFYQCGGTGMHGGEIIVYSAPSFTVYKDLAPKLEEQAMIYACHGYNATNNSYVYSIAYYSGSNEPTQPVEILKTYYFDTGVVQ